MFRRRFLGGVVHMLAAGSLVACSDTETAGSISAAAGDEDPQVELAALLYDLFPYQGLAAAVYMTAAAQILSRENPLIDDGLHALRTASGNRPWSELTESERLRLLQTQEDTPFFMALRAAAIENLYRDPVLWDYIGYGGSSIEHGGYLKRGFDDISWLPAREVQ